MTAVSLLVRLAGRRYGGMTGPKPPRRTQPRGFFVYAVAYLVFL